MLSGRGAYTAIVVNSGEKRLILGLVRPEPEGHFTPSTLDEVFDIAETVALLQNRQVQRTRE